MEIRFCAQNVDVELNYQYNWIEKIDQFMRCYLYWKTNHGSLKDFCVLGAEALTAFGLDYVFNDICTKNKRGSVSLPNKGKIYCPL